MCPAYITYLLDIAISSHFEVASIDEKIRDRMLDWSLEEFFYLLVKLFGHSGNARRR